MLLKLTLLYFLFCVYFIPQKYGLAFYIRYCFRPEHEGDFNDHHIYSIVCKAVGGITSFLQHSSVTQCSIPGRDSAFCLGSRMRSQVDQSCYRGGAILASLIYNPKFLNKILTVLIQKYFLERITQHDQSKFTCKVGSTFKN